MTAWSTAAAAVFTAGALLVALLLYQRERRRHLLDDVRHARDDADREAAQARSVVIAMDKIAHRGLYEYLTVVLHNFSPAPITDVILRARTTDRGPQPWSRKPLTVLPPGGKVSIQFERPVVPVVHPKPVDDAWSVLEAAVVFTAASGLLWGRRGRMQPERVAAGDKTLSAPASVEALRVEGDV